MPIDPNLQIRGKNTGFRRESQLICVEVKYIWEPIIDAVLKAVKFSGQGMYQSIAYMIANIYKIMVQKKQRVAE